MATFNKISELEKQENLSPDRLVKLSGMKRLAALSAGYDRYGNRLKGSGLIQGAVAAAAVGFAPFTGGASLGLLALNTGAMLGQRATQKNLEGTEKEKIVDRYEGDVLKNTLIGAGVGLAGAGGASLLGAGTAPATTTAATTGTTAAKAVAGTAGTVPTATTVTNTATTGLAGMKPIPPLASTATETSALVSNVGPVKDVTMPMAEASNVVQNVTQPTVKEAFKLTEAQLKQQQILHNNIKNVISGSKGQLSADYVSKLKFKDPNISIAEFNKAWYNSGGKELLQQTAVQEGTKFALNQLEQSIQEDLYKEQDFMSQNKRSEMAFENAVTFENGGKIPNSAPSHKDGGVKVLNKNGKVIAEVEGGEEVFSVKETKKIEQLAQKNDLSLLGKFVKQSLINHRNNSSPQYAESGTNNLGLNDFDLLAKNDSIKNLQKIILKIEAGSAGYNSVVKSKGDEDLTKMTYAEARRKHGNKAIGAYQIIGSTGDEALKALGENPETFVLTKENQDKLFYYLLKKRGAVDYVQGKINEDEFVKRLSAEWAAIPQDQTNKSYYEGDKYGNKALVDYNTMIKALQANKPLTQEEINKSITEGFKTNPEGQIYSEQYKRYQEATKRGSNYSTKELDAFENFIKQSATENFFESKQDAKYKKTKSDRDLLIKQIEAKKKGDSIVYLDKYSNQNLNQLEGILKGYNTWLLEQDQKIASSIKLESDKLKKAASKSLEIKLQKNSISTEDYTKNLETFEALTKPINDVYKNLTVNNLAAKGNLSDIKFGDRNKTAIQKETEQKLAAAGFYDDPSKYLFKSEDVAKNLMSYTPPKNFNIKIEKDKPLFIDKDYVPESDIAKWKTYETDVTSTLQSERKKQFEDLMGQESKDYDVISDIDVETKTKTNNVVSLMSDAQVKSILADRDNEREQSGLVETFNKLGGWNTVLDMTGMALAYNEATKPLPQQKKSDAWVAQTDILKARQNVGLSESERDLYQRQSERTYATNVALIGRYGTSGQAVLGSLQGAAEKKYDADLKLTAMDAAQRRQNITDYSNWLSKDEEYTQKIWNNNVFEPAARNQALKAGLIGATFNKIKDNISYYKNYEDPSSLYQKLMNQQLKNEQSANQMYNVSLVKNMGGTSEQIIKAQEEIATEKEQNKQNDNKNIFSRFLKK